jgi:DNA-binding response OmpR family regulator
MKTILVVDDEPAILDLLTTLLEEEGYRVLSAVDGAAALEGLDQEAVDVVITDGMMPRLGGEALIRALRERPETRDVPVIFVSAAVTPRLEGLEPCWVLPKPFDLGDVLATIATATGRPPARARTAQDRSP